MSRTYDSDSDDEHVAGHMDGKEPSSSSCGCSLVGCKNEVTCVCNGCKIATYCSEEHQVMDWAKHHVACNMNVSENMTRALWTTEEEVGHAIGDADEKWIACDLVHAHLGQNGLIGHPLQNADVIAARNEHIEGFATFGSDATLTRGTQRLPSGAMHRGETVEMYVEIGNVRAHITGIKLPQNAHYNILRANKGYNVYLTERDIQASRKFRTVPASGSVFVGLGTAEQKSLIFGNYSVVKTRPATGRETALDLLSRALRMPKKVRIKAFDQQTQMMATLTLEQDVSAMSRANPGDEPMYSVTYVEVYVPFHYTTGHSVDKSWDEVVNAEVAEASGRGQTVSGRPAASAEAPPPPPPPRDDAAAIATFLDALAFYREDTGSKREELAAINTIATVLGEDGGEQLEQFIGLNAEAGFDSSSLDVEAIAGVVDRVKQYAAKKYQQFQAWRARRKGKSSGGDDADVDAQIVDQIGISILDRVKNLKARAQKTAALKLMKDGPLTDLLRSQVTQAETLRAAGNNATDNVNYALNIVQEMRRRDIPMTAEIADLQTRVNKLSATKGAVAQGKRQQRAVSAAEQRAANMNKLYGRGEAAASSIAAQEMIGKELLEFCAMERWDAPTMQVIDASISCDCQENDAEDALIASSMGTLTTMDVQEIAGLIQRFKDWRAKRKAAREAKKRGEEPIESSLEALDQIGISVLDRLKNLKARAQKTAALKLMKDGPLTDLLRSQVTQAETLRAAGNNATDNVNYALNIVQEMRRRDIPVTPEIADLQTRVNKLSATKGAVAQGKRQQRAVSAAEQRAANMNKLYGRGEAAAAEMIRPIDAEVLEDVVALVDTLTEVQAEVKKEFALFAHENRGANLAEVKAMENQIKEMSRIRAVLIQHASDLHDDEKGLKDYDEIGVHVHEAINHAQDDFLGVTRVGISILDRIKNARARAQKTRALKTMRDSALIDLLRSQVQSAETLRAAGNNATDNVNYALNIREEIRRRDVPLTPEIVDLITRLNTLQATKGAAAQGKRQTSAVSAADLRAANRDKLYGRTAAATPAPPPSEGSN